ncbi:MAG: hemerythrin domain-containing protein [Actinomycetota bacterium]
MDNRDWIAFAGGASVGLVAGHLLPPLLAQAAVLLGGNPDPFDLLADDHRHFLDLLRQMEGARGSGLAFRTQLFLRLKRSLAAHSMAEEDVIYPLLAEEAGAHAAAERLYAEHGAIKTHLYALERLLGDDVAWAERASALKRLVADHARREEEVEFPRLRHRLDEDAFARLARHVRREKAMVV